jgi:hypothetical protein
MFKDSFFLRGIFYLVLTFIKKDCFETTINMNKLLGSIKTNLDDSYATKLISSIAQRGTIKNDQALKVFFNLLESFKIKNHMRDFKNLINLIKVSFTF